MPVNRDQLLDEGVETLALIGGHPTVAIVNT